MSLPASVATEDGSGQRPARLVDLGLGGACVSLQEGVATGSAVTLVIDAPHLWDPLEIAGIVAWTRHDAASQQALLGVKFDRPSATTLRRTAELLETTSF